MLTHLVVHEAVANGTKIGTRFTYLGQKLALLGRQRFDIAVLVAARSADNVDRQLVPLLVTELALVRALLALRGGHVVIDGTGFGQKMSIQIATQMTRGITAFDGTLFFQLHSRRNWT